MENQDSGPAPAGIDVTTSSFSAAVQNLQVFAEEIGRVSRTSFEQNAKLIDDLSTAREVGDIVAIQMKFMTGMLDTFNEQIQLMMSRMANFPLGAPHLAEGFTWPLADLAPSQEKAAGRAEIDGERCRAEAEWCDSRQHASGFRDGDGFASGRVPADNSRARRAGRGARTRGRR